MFKEQQSQWFKASHLALPNPLLTHATPFLLKIIRALGTVSAKACITYISLTLGILVQETPKHQGRNLTIVATLSGATAARRGDGHLRNTTPAACGPR